MADAATAGRRPAAAPSLGRLVLVVFLPFAGGYFLSYLYRAVNAVIAPDLTATLGLTASGLGLLTAAYFLSFAAFQLPLGVLLDRYGPRRVQALLLTVAAGGAVVFGLSPTLDGLVIGRALIGFGVAGGLMASFKAIALWFPEERWPLVNGCFMTMGGLGATAATAPVEWLLQVTDWRGVFLGLAAATLVAAAVIFLVVPEKPGQAPRVRWGESLAGVRAVFTDRLFWRVAPLTIAAMATTMAMQTLWLGPWLADVQGLARDAVAVHLFWSAIAMTVGFVATGWVADRLGRLGIGLFAVMTAATVVLIAIQMLIVALGAATGLLPWLAFGLFANVTVLSYPLLLRHFPASHGGRASTALNMLMFVVVFFVQWAIGWVVDLWPEGPGGGEPGDAYRVALGLLVALQGVTLAWLVLFRAPVPRERGRQG